MRGQREHAGGERGVGGGVDDGGIQEAPTELPMN